MKRFRFALQRLLTLKSQRERQAEQAQRLARLHCESARAEALRLRQQLEMHAAAAGERNARRAEAGFWLASSLHLSQLSQALDAAEARVAEADRKLAEAARRRAQIASEAESLRQLQQHAWQAYRREIARAQQKQADEAALRGCFEPPATPLDVEPAGPATSPQVPS